jgi:serine/threonine protein kinase
MLGRVLDGRFRIDALLGEGGLGQVYRGTHLRLARPVAIKVMHAHHVTKDELRTRFDREARSLAALAHPNVVGVIDYGVDGDLPFLVMDFLEGRTLEAAIHDGLPFDRVVPIFRDVLRAVAYAHGIGLVHRDLKPANVFLQKVPELGEVVRVLDFGLAKFVDGQGVGATVTRAGMVIGTPAYMSPEQATASMVDARADVYSLGVLLFEMVTGRRPFTGDDGAEVLRKHLLQPLPTMKDLAPSSPLASLLQPIVTRATEKSKGDRYADASEMASALDGLVGRASTPVMAAPARPPSSDKTSAASIHVTISDVPISVSGPAQRPPPTPSTPPSSALPVIAMAAVIGIVGMGSLAYFLGSNATPTPAATDAVLVPPPPSTTATATPPPPPPTSVVVPPTTLAFVPPEATVVVAPPPEATTVEVIAPPPEATTVEVIAPPPPATETPNPWASPIPPQLASVEERVRSEREISADQRELLYRFSRNHPHDPRALLLLGHAEVIAHAYTDATHRYQHAFDVDANARFDAAMRHDLVRLAANAALTRDASRMVRAIYGAEALPEITRVEGELASDHAALARLGRLRETLATP